ncbi:glycosyl hydrolase [Algibacillus agarilyticus]|uniref:glycosyl hydrolase n=1 Tax=Algibacillus agarilyticus TaxID=2234133 RepID=UPI000DD00C19|nr:glycosyl hydrolase [Algibacillus agarilyticus]
MNKNNTFTTAIIVAFSLTLLGCQPEQSSQLNKQKAATDASPTKRQHETHGQLVADFITPPHSSKPLTWFHAMSGNMSAAGITKDLEAIAEAGLGGTLLFNVTQGIPLGKVKFNSTEHIDLIGHMAKESQRLDLSFGMHNCDGWTSSGGPWVTPEHSMKRLTFNEMLMSGGDLNIKMPQPSSILNYYQDIAVIAYPALATEIDDANRKPVISASDPNFDPTLITNHDLTDYSTLTPQPNTAANTAAKTNEQNSQSAWLQFSYQRPYTLRLVDMLLHNGRGLNVELQVSNDGKNFTMVDKLTLRRPGKFTYGFDEAFEGHTAKHFRLVTNKAMNIKELKLSSTPAINNYLGRTSASRSDYQEFTHIGAPSADLTIDSNKVINLSQYMNAQGQLVTTLPQGQWTIMRFGYTSTGAVNIPASREGTGLEVDKFSKAAFKAHYDAYITNVINKVKEVAPNALHTLEIDSYEVGAQNWTHQYEQQFTQQYGYDLVPYLPLFAGKFVDSPTTSESVLWDTRDFNNQLITENYYGYFTELANQDGIKTYLEPYGSGPFNELDVARKADLPMGEFWLENNNFRISASSSTAHIYNKPLVSAEAFTQFPGNNWLFSPAMGKPDNDKSWALGVNQHVFHRFAHQANTHVMPGMTMNRWGAHMDRTQPWWNGAGKAWFEYIARGQHLLRVGHAVSDVLWYLGDATPTTCPEKDLLSALLPININYDCLNSEVLQQLTVDNGKLKLPHGSEYKVIVLNNHKTLTFKSLLKLHQLAKQGAVIIGQPVERLAGRFNTPEQQQQFMTMVNDIWSLPTTYNVATAAKTNHGHAGLAPEHTLAEKTLINWQQIYQENNWQLDLAIANQPHYYFTHRRSDTHDIYFIYNDKPEATTLDARFNVSGKVPEIWDAQTGKIKRLAAFSDNGTTTQVPITLAANQSLFVVFQQSAKNIEPIPPAHALQQKRNLILSTKNQALTLHEQADAHEVKGEWQVQFSGFYGLNKQYNFSKLVDWRAHPEQAIQDYSGTAIYRKSINLPPHYIADDLELTLDLGEVSVAATVKINGQLVGTTWMSPYQLDITKFIKAGKNDLEIEVANLWVNRLLADYKHPDTSGFKIARWQDPITPMPSWYTNNQPPPASKRITFSTQRFMQDNEPRQQSGLIGPVNIIAHQIKGFTLN